VSEELQKAYDLLRERLVKEEKEYDKLRNDNAKLHLRLEELHAEAEVAIEFMRKYKTALDVLSK
jgi:uncharacterized protein with von Willebrand factor type A (vWA) domain